MASEMDLAFYFHQGRHDFSTMHGENMAPSPLNRISLGSCGSPARTLLNCYSSRIVRRDLCLSSSLTDSFTCMQWSFLMWICLARFAMLLKLVGKSTLGPYLDLCGLSLFRDKRVNLVCIYIFPGQGDQIFLWNIMLFVDQNLCCVFFRIIINIRYKNRRQRKISVHL